MNLRKSIKIDLNPDDPVDKLINKYLDSQKNISHTTKLLLLKSYYQFGEKDLQTIINEKAMRGESFEFSNLKIENKKEEQPVKVDKNNEGNKPNFGTFFDNKNNFGDL
ncbi:hypothetical protein ACKN8S_13530 (plasmid) [Limosilactobacillus reuteri]|uniref:hypothetical protein n=1 Tax=Limosilactobacillus reuteri TaxID=1598 RepID=UPI0039BF3B98